MKQTIYDKVKEILEDYPDARENYTHLYWIFYNERDFFHILAEIRSKRLPSFEAVSRARRKVQEDHPHLRGKTYGKRLEKEHEVRQAINVNSEEILFNL